MTKLLNFFGNHVVTSDVHGMFAERKTHHMLSRDTKSPPWFLIWTTK